MSELLPPTLQVGQSLGPYEVIAPLAAGGMGEVWQALDRRLDRGVALKVLPRELSRDPERLRRFRHEARAVSRLNHPNILTVFDIGTHEGAPFIVFELLEGETLRARIASGRLDLGTCVKYGTQIATGLAAAHAKGIVHRDLKPENVFITCDDLIKVLDFGLAKLTRPEDLLHNPSELRTITQITEAGAIVGTIGYMSPEQVRGDSADVRSDIFSFGVILYEMLSGRRAFTGNTTVAVMHAILSGEPPALAQADCDVPPSLARIVQQCLEKRPEERFQSAPDLASQLRLLPIPSACDSPRGTAPAGTPKRVMIVVLPFENLSRDEEQEYFSDGLTGETIAVLGGLAPEQLGVIARTSAMSYKGMRKSIAEIGRELGVDFAVEGSVRQQGHRVRIAAQLIRTGDQTHVWAQQYDRDLSDFLGVQAELGQAIAEQVQVKLTTAEPARLSSARPLNRAAFEAYLHGVFHLWKVTRHNLERAAEYFAAAVEIDPNMAAAHAGLAQAFMVQPVAADARPSDAFPRAIQAATRALELDPSSAEAHTAIAALRHWYEWNWSAAEEHARRAIASNPSYSRAHQVLGRLLTNIGRHEEAIAEIDLARRLDPLAPLINTLSADFRFQARRYEEVLPLIQMALKLDPGFWVAHASLARLYQHEARWDEALAAALKAKECSRGHSLALALIGFSHARGGCGELAHQALSELEHRRIETYAPASHLATVHLGLGNTESALRWLERGIDERDVWLSEVSVEPRWDQLRTHPTFQRLVRRLGFPGEFSYPLSG